MKGGLQPYVTGMARAPASASPLAADQEAELDLQRGESDGHPQAALGNGCLIRASGMTTAGVQPLAEQVHQISAASPAPEKATPCTT